ncbi:MAG: hypothetical protein OXD44_01095 [Gammaproteobacteria bacterium]|nr:hypothetical protein [Gammaproteobacteria bacterium]
MPPFNGIALRPINPRQQASGARRKSGNYPEAGAGTAKPLAYDHAVSMLAIGNPLDKAIIALALMAGLRRSEIATSPGTILKNPKTIPYSFMFANRKPAGPVKIPIYDY